MKTFLPSVVALCPVFPSKRSEHLLAIVCAVSALVLVCAATGLAQDLKLGFVDLQKFATKSVKAQAMQKRITALVNANMSQPSLESEKKELAVLWERLIKLGPMMNDEAWNQILEEIRIKKRRLTS
jgi:hypothetical protein